MDRRNFLSKILGGAGLVAAVAVLGTNNGEAQRVVKPVADRLNMLDLGSNPGIPQEYVNNFEAWVKDIVATNEAVKKEIAAVSKLPNLGEDNYKNSALLVFETGQPGFPQNLQIIKGSNEKLLVEISPKGDGKVYIHIGGWVDRKDFPNYESKGFIEHDHSNGEEVRIFVSGIEYDTTTSKFVVK